ncbi:MAG: hypothetical protein V1854_07690 [Methanobacteriota archaeon]
MRTWDGAGVSPPDDSLINGWLPPASGIDILYTATHITVRSETARRGNPVNDTQVDQDENQTNHSDGLCVSLPDGLPDQHDDLPDVAHNPEPQSSVR